MGRGAPWATVLRVRESQTQLKRLSTHASMCLLKAAFIFPLAYRSLNKLRFILHVTFQKNSQALIFGILLDSVHKDPIHIFSK